MTPSQIYREQAEILPRVATTLQQLPSSHRNAHCHSAIARALVTANELIDGATELESKELAVDYLADLERRAKATGEVS